MTNEFRAMCAELVEALHEHTCLYEGHESELVTRARTLLDQPVAASERLPGPEDCDEYGQCWWFSQTDPPGDWFLDTFQGNYTHWLPANALPTPEATND